MSVMHYGGDTVGLKAPLCNRVPNWARMTNQWESVTCKHCLKKKASTPAARRGEG